jgi:hypothetical protein
MKILAALLVTVVAIAGCRDRDRVWPVDTVPSVTPLPPAPVRSAYLSVSDLQPEPGGTVVVGGTVSVGTGFSLGSFRVRLAYDSTRLSYIDELTSPGMLRVVNPQPGEIVVAGASSSASEDGRLFTLRFRVDDRVGLNSLLLHVDEMNDGSFTSLVTTVTRSSRLVLDPSLRPGKEIPR